MANEETLRTCDGLSRLKSILSNDHVNINILRACEMLESAVYGKKKRYSAKVEVLMSVLENLLTDCLVRVAPEMVAAVFDYILKYTLLLVLHGAWGESKAVRSHMVELFTRFKMRARKKKLDRVVSEIDYLLVLMGADPWANVEKIIQGEKETDEELFEFVRSEIGVFLNVRLEVLFYARCEPQAMKLIEKSLCCVEANSEYFQPFACGITRLRDMYLLVLNKAESCEYMNKKILKEVKKLGLKECVGFVKRCRRGELPFEILREKSATVVVNMALASAVIEENTDEEILQQLVQLWFDTKRDDEVLIRLLKTMVANAVCPRYIYAFGEKLIERIKLKDKESCVEVFVRGLTLNLNEIERYEVNEEHSKVEQLKVQLSKGLLQLAEYLKDDVLLYREFILAEFSLNPSQSGFERIKRLGENSDKNGEMKMGDIGDNQSQNKLGENKLKCNQSNGNSDNSVIRQSDLGSTHALQPVLDPIDSSVLEQDFPSCGRSSTVNPSVRDAVQETVKKMFQELEPKEQILNEHAIDKSKSSDDTAYSNLSKDISGLTLKDANQTSDHDKENNPVKESKFHSDQGTLQCLKVYDAESKGISQTLCDDLSILVSSLKDQELSCELEWSEVIRRCETYIAEGGKKKKVNCNMSEKENCDSSCGGKGNLSANVFQAKVGNPSKSSKRKRKIRH